MQSSEGLLICSATVTVIPALLLLQDQDEVPTPRLPFRERRPQDHCCGGSPRSHLDSDYQDLNHLQHQLEGLAALGPELVTGAHEEVLEPAAQVLFLH